MWSWQVCSIVSTASVEEHAFLALGGASFGALSSSLIMAQQQASSSAGARYLPGQHPTTEALLPRCSEGADSGAMSRPSADDAEGCE